MYIYELPYLERKELCDIVDRNNKYEELAVNYMKFDLTTAMQIIRSEMCRCKSPTDEFLTQWSHKNHTVNEIFFILYEMRYYEAMKIILKFVDPEYHYLIKTKPLQTAKSHVINLENISNGMNNDKEVNANKFVVSCENNEMVGEPTFHHPRFRLPIAVASNSKMLTVSEISCVVESAGAIPHIPYEELRKSTNNWDSTSILGKGGFGTVFKGTWKCTQVAIKRIEQKEESPESHNEQIKQSIRELHCLNSYRHDNVLPLYGYSIGGSQPCLVYQYMSGGSLDHRLHTKDSGKVLNWPTRLNIAIGIARGLQFLHTIGDKPLIHGDIKSANILLDPNDTPRIGDFGLAREGPQSHYTHIKLSKIHGTRPYLPDEFLRAKEFSTKVDTYSFGVVLFEIATSLTAYSTKYKLKFLRDHIVHYEGNILELKDQRVDGGEKYFTSLIDIGKVCVNVKAKDRPEMVSVLIKLEEASKEFDTI